MTAGLDLRRLREANARLARHVDPDGTLHGVTLGSLRLAASAGRAAQAVRDRLSLMASVSLPPDGLTETALRRAIAEALADVVLDADLLAHAHSVDLFDAVAVRFDEEAMLSGCDERLAEAAAGDGGALPPDDPTTAAAQRDALVEVLRLRDSLQRSARDRCGFGSDLVAHPDRLMLELRLRDCRRLGIDTDAWRIAGGGA